MPDRSDTSPTSGGTSAPPTIALHSRPDTDAAGALERSRVRVNKVGNITELKKPSDKAVPAASAPRLCDTVRHRTTLMIANTPSTRPALTTRSNWLPANRPSIAPPQNTAPSRVAARDSDTPKIAFCDRKLTMMVDTPTSEPT